MIVMPNIIGTISFRSDDSSRVGHVVKLLAERFGFDWKSLPDYPLPSDAAIVLVAPYAEEGCFRALGEKCGVWNREKGEACACYELGIGRPSEEDVGESLTDWMLTEIQFYGRCEICFEGSDALAESELGIFESMLADAMKAVSRCVKKIIMESPFVKEVSADDVSWSFAVKDPASGKIVSASLHPLALFDSLGKESGDEDDLLVCGCSDAGCAGFTDEKFDTSDLYVHWSLKEYGKPYSWYFDRRIYETGAVKMLREIYETKKGWDFNALYYSSYEDFRADVDEFLAAKPRFRAMWDEIGGR